jgi:hypothetical protein
MKPGKPIIFHVEAAGEFRPVELTFARGWLISPSGGAQQVKRLNFLISLPVESGAVRDR